MCTYNVATVKVMQYRSTVAMLSEGFDRAPIFHSTLRTNLSLQLIT